MRIFQALLVLFASACLSALTHAEPTPVLAGAVDLRDWNAAQSTPKQLRGDWHFVPGQWLQPESLAATNPASQLQKVPGAWTLPHNSQRGIGTYWLDLNLSLNAQTLTFWVQRLCSAADIYWIQPSGTINHLGRHGQPGQAANERPEPGLLMVPLAVEQAGRHRLVLQLSNFNYSQGGLCGRIGIGASQTLTELSLRRTSLLTSQIAVMLAVALFALAIFLQKRNERASLWLSLTCLSLAGFHFISNGLWDLLIGNQHLWQYNLRYRLLYTAAAWTPTALIMFYVHSFHWRFAVPIAQINLVLALACTLVVWLSAPIDFTGWSLPFSVVWSLQSCTALLVLLRAVWRKLSQAQWMLLAITPLALAVPADLYLALGHREQSTQLFTPYAVMFFLGIQAYLTSVRFARAFQLAEGMSSRLARKIAERTRTLREQNQELEAARQQLTEANENLRRLSITDGLTQVYNRLYFEQEFQQEWRRCSRQALSISVLMVDADHFKQLNDSAGHLVGDKCLQEIASILQHQFRRARELVARYGGEEFVVMLPDTSQSQALGIAEGLRAAIAQTTFHYGERAFQVTVSIGVATTVPHPGDVPDQLLEAADAALYHAKAEGRNRIASAPMRQMRTNDQKSSNPV